MNAFIAKIKKDLEKNNQKLAEVPDWSVQDLRLYYTKMVPIMMDKYFNSSPEEEKKEFIKISLHEHLSECIDDQKKHIIRELTQNNNRIKNFLKNYDLCCQEYGDEIEVTSYEDIKDDILNLNYRVVIVPKIGLNLLCDNAYNVLKKNTIGNRYTTTLFNRFTSEGVYEISPLAVYFYANAKSVSPIYLGPSSPEQNITFYRDYLSSVRYRDNARYLFNEKFQKIMIDDFEEIKPDQPLNNIFGNHDDYHATIYKTLCSETNDLEAFLIFLINREGIVISDIWEDVHKKSYKIDKTLPQCVAIKKVYDTILSEEKNKNEAYKYTYRPKNKDE